MCLEHYCRFQQSKIKLRNEPSNIETNLNLMLKSDLKSTINSGYHQLNQLAIS